MRRRYSESELDNKKEACKKRISPNGIRLANPISEDTICTDITGKKWRIGRSAGVGGFGDIYLVSDDTSKPVGEDAQFVVKVEPHHSGPLFVERNFYVRVAKQEMIDEWKQARGLTHLGISPYVASGSHMYRGKLYRFLVLERFGSDLGKLFQSSGRRFHLKTALYIALQILDTLEYIHDKGYCHADVKDSNVLLGHRKGTENQVYLLDYGLASMLYNENGKHKEYGPDERRAHAGTIEFVNRDGHQGACSRRGDLETLGYNLLQWLCGRLPWTDDTGPAKPDYVYLQKKWFMSNISTWVKRCYSDSEPPGAVIQYLKYVAGLNFESKPNYAYCKMIFRQGIKDAYFVDDGKLVFGLSPTVKTTKKLCGKRKILEEPENLENGRLLKVSKVCRSFNMFRKPCVPHNINRMTRNSPGSQVLLRSQHFSWTKVLSGDPEKILFPEKKVRKVGHMQKMELPGTIVPNSRLANKIRERMMPLPKDEVEVRKGLDSLPYFAVYTPAMLRVIMRKKLSKMVAVPAARKQRSDSSYSSSSEVPACFQGYNYAMMEIAQGIQKRKQAEAQEHLACSRRICKPSPRAKPNSKTTNLKNHLVTMSKTDLKSRSLTVSKTDFKSHSATVSKVDLKSRSLTVSNTDLKSHSLTVSKTDLKSRSVTVSKTDLKSRSVTVSKTDLKNHSVTWSKNGLKNRSATVSKTGWKNCSATVSKTGWKNRSATVSKTGWKNCSATVPKTGWKNRSATVSKTGSKNRSVTASETESKNHSGKVLKTVAVKQTSVALRTSARAAKLRAMKQAQQKAALAHNRTRLLRSNFVECQELQDTLTDQEWRE